MFLNVLNDNAYITAPLKELIPTSRHCGSLVPQGLYAPIAYVLSMGGKRIRPVLMLMAYNLKVEDITCMFAPATGIEVYHNYTFA